MTQESDKFVQEMLKKANEKKETEARTRTHGVDHAEVEDVVADVLGWKVEKKKKEE